MRRAHTKPLDVSLEIKPGTITALVDESGGGKSTIANLIARFGDTQAGTVRIGNVDVRVMDYDEWMKQVSIVFQDTNLFKMSILDNVAFYKPGSHTGRSAAGLASGTVR